MHANYKYVNGFPADEIAISERLMLNMVRCKSVKEAVVAANVIGNIITGTPSIDQLNEVMTRRFLPKFVLVDDRVEITDETGASIPTRVLDEGTIVFLSRQAQFNRILGGTLENGGRSGVYVNTYTKAGDPPLSITNTASMQLISAATISKTGSARKMAKLANLEASENLAEFTTFNPADGLTIIS
jgi:hypothetical protein